MTTGGVRPGRVKVISDSPSVFSTSSPRYRARCRRLPIVRRLTTDHGESPMTTPPDGEPKPESKPKPKVAAKRVAVLLVKYLTPPEISKSLRVSVQTVRAWIKKGRLKAINVADKGRPKFRVRPEVLVEFEQSLQVKSDTPKAVVSMRQRPHFVNPFFPERG